MSRFIFIANSKSFELEITGSTEEETTVNTYWVLSPFVTSMNQETGAAQVAYYQQNTEELRERVRDIVTQIKHLNPRINRLTDYFEKELTPNEWFFLSVDEALRPEDTDKILADLMKIGADEKMEKQINGTIEILHKIKEVYDIYIYMENIQRHVLENLIKIKESVDIVIVQCLKFHLKKQHIPFQRH